MSAAISIVLEWETVLEGKRERGVACLRSLHRQLSEWSGDAELIVCFDPAETGEASVREAMDEAAGGRPWPGRVVVAAAPERLDYYQKKNHGFTLTGGEIVIFLDSDLGPEADWLRNLVAPFDDFRKSIVVGRTHLETRTLYERAVALFWIFDAREESAPVRLTQRLVSNNIAFRRPVFAHFPFPKRPTFRGQCSELGAILSRHAIVMYEQPAARACHPAPDGIRRFLSRAFHAGDDHAFYDGLDSTATFAHCLRNGRTDLGHVSERIAERRAAIGASALDVLAARVLGFVYYGTKSAGYCSRLLRFSAVRDRLFVRGPQPDR